MTETNYGRQRNKAVDLKCHLNAHIQREKSRNDIKRQQKVVFHYRETPSVGRKGGKKLEFTLFSLHQSEFCLHSSLHVKHRYEAWHLHRLSQLGNAASVMWSSSLSCHFEAMCWMCRENTESFLQLQSC